MAPDDGDDDDAPVFGEPLPQDDRLWRHPSEVGAALLPASSAARRPVPVWSVAVVAGLLGAVATLGVFSLTTGFGSSVVERPVVEKVPVSQIVTDLVGARQSSGVVSITHQVSPAIARLEVTSAAGSSSGSGVLFRDDGYLLTSAHIVNDARSVVVVLADGSDHGGVVVGSDPWTDIAVLKIEGTNFAVAVLGTASSLQVGQPAISIGSPLGIDGSPSVSVGVVSALGRHVASADGVELHGMIETDAKVTSEAQGGALVDGSGVVIGITTSPSGTDGLSYATPIDVAKAVATDIVATGSAHHVWLGIQAADVDSTTAKALGVRGGTKLSAVMPDSPAAVAGLLVDDVITDIDGVNVSSMTGLVLALRSHNPGDVVQIAYLRAGEHHSCTATLAERDHP
jgi:S1-C subfamily serine protease